MLDAWTPLTFPPGLYRNGTVYQSKGRYYDASLVRFFEGTIQPIYGWRRVQDTATPPANITTLTGTPRGARSWRSDDGQSYTVIATVSNTANQSKLYILTGMTSQPPGAALFDETPAGGLIGGKVDAGPSGGFGNFGNGFFGFGLFGTGQTGGTWTDADTWSLDTFGQSLVAVSTIDQKLYVWAANTGVPAARPVWGPVFTAPLQTMGVTAGGATVIVMDAPALTGTILAGQTFIISGVTYIATVAATAVANVLTVDVSETPVPAGGIADNTAVTGTDTQAPLCHAVVVTPERFLMALGSDSNVRLVRWADRESTTQWGILSTNSAGDYPLKTDGRILCGAKTRNQTLICTDIDIWVANFIGGDFIYRFDQAGTNCGLISANAGVSSDTRFFWMGQNAFFVFDGYVRSMPCDVADYVFSRLNSAQKSKVWAMAKPQFAELWWHYPSGSNLECDSYVVYNERENHWTTGTLAWATGFENGPTQYPIVADSSGAVWEAEVPGASRVGTPYVATGPIEIGQGDQIIKLSQMVVDASLTAGTADVNAVVMSALFPTDTETTSATFPLLPQPAPMRITGRQVRFKFTEANAVNWRLGATRIAAHAGGRR